jgi:hypothetical protein
MNVALQIGPMAEQVQAYYLQAVLQVTAEANAAWLMSEWQKGRKVDCCAACAGVLYLEPAKALSQTFHSAATILKNPNRGWSCADLAALDAGYLLAEEMKRGGSGVGIRVALEQVGPHRWHAVVVTPSGVRDPSKRVAKYSPRRSAAGSISHGIITQPGGRRT